MRIQYTKEYTRKNETPCVLLYCNERKIFWFGKKYDDTTYRGTLMNKIIKCNEIFFYNENLVYKTVSGHLDKYYISESDFNFLIDKIKTRNDFNRVVDSMVELKKED